MHTCMVPYNVYLNMPNEELCDPIKNYYKNKHRQTKGTKSTHNLSRRAEEVCFPV